MSHPNETYIARNKKCKHWHAAKNGLVVGGEPQLWKTACADYFRGRLEDRYLEPIKTLQTHGQRVGEGFSIATIQCSLVEFFESTVQGKNYRYLQKGDKLGPHEYSKSRELFVSFLCNRQPFATIFRQAPALAEDFYSSVRCGLLHEARTKNGWLIQAGKSAKTIVDGSRHVLYRDKFQEALLQFVAGYEQALPFDVALQEAFIRKFDALCQ